MKEWVARDSWCRRYVGVVWVVLRVLQTSTDSIYITTETHPCYVSESIVVALPMFI